MAGFPTAWTSLRITYLLLRPGAKSGSSDHVLLTVQERPKAKFGRCRLIWMILAAVVDPLIGFPLRIQGFSISIAFLWFQK